MCWALWLAAVSVDFPKVTWLLSKSVKDKFSKVLLRKTEKSLRILWKRETEIKVDGAGWKYFQLKIRGHLPERREPAGWMGKAHLKMTTDGSYTSPSAFKGCWGSSLLNFNQQKRWVFISPPTGLKTNLKRSVCNTEDRNVTSQQTPEQTRLLRHHVSYANSRRTLIWTMAALLRPLNI